jgi:hypothetical protein
VGGRRRSSCRWRRCGDLEAQGGSAIWGEEGGDRGEPKGLLTLDGEGWQTADDGQPWRPARSARGGDAPALRR